MDVHFEYGKMYSQACAMNVFDGLKCNEKIKLEWFRLTYGHRSVEVVFVQALRGAHRADLSISLILIRSLHSSSTAK